MNKKMNKVYKILLVSIAIIEIGIGIGYYIVLNIDFDKYNKQYNIEVRN